MHIAGFIKFIGFPVTPLIPGASDFDSVCKNGKVGSLGTFIAAYRVNRCLRTLTDSNGVPLIPSSKYFVLQLRKSRKLIDC
jgi:hypothetical protein